MRRSNFRALQKRNSSTQVAAPAPVDSALDQLREEVASLRSQLSGVAPAISGLRSIIDGLKRQEDLDIPSGILKTVELLHSRLDRMEKAEHSSDAEERRARQAFAQSVLELNRRIEKIAGKSDSEFSLAHSLEELISVLKAPLDIKRDAEGNMKTLTPKA